MVPLGLLPTVRGLLDGKEDRFAIWYLLHVLALELLFLSRLSVAIHSSWWICCSESMVVLGQDKAKQHSWDRMFRFFKDSRTPSLKGSSDDCSWETVLYTLQTVADDVDIHEDCLVLSVFFVQDCSLYLLDATMAEKSPILSTIDGHMSVQSTFRSHWWLHPIATRNLSGEISPVS